MTLSEFYNSTIYQSLINKRNDRELIRISIEAYTDKQITLCMRMLNSISIAMLADKYASDTWNINKKNHKKYSGKLNSLLKLNNRSRTHNIYSYETLEYLKIPKWLQRNVWNYVLDGILTIK